MKGIILAFVCFVFAISAVSATIGYSSVTYPTPTFSYSSSDATMYWPVLSNEEGVCRSRQDMILQVAPAGCQPVVVRSDLLAEQNVPVFCQIDALKVNPLIDLKAIDTITFSGKYPAEVVGTGFHPAQAALYSSTQLLGNPLLNNIGYVVVVLKREANESALPEEVHLNLTARIQYNAYNAIGVGQASFVMPVMNDNEWGANVTARTAQSFWQGRYFARVESADSNSAVISIYYGDRKIATTRVDRGKQSSNIFVPGFASCGAALQIAYDGFQASEDRAVLEISDDRGTDIFTAYGSSGFLGGSGTRFYNDKCYVSSINLVKGSTNYGSVDIVCNSQRFSLSLSAQQTAGTSQTGAGLTVKTVQSLLDRANELFRQSADSTDTQPTIQLLDDTKSLEIITQVQYDSMKQDAEQNGARNIGSLISILQNKITELSAQTIQSGLLSNNKYYQPALADYKKVATTYPGEKQGSDSNAKTYGEQALSKAILLAHDAGDFVSQRDLLNSFINIYPTSDQTAAYKTDLANLEQTNFAKSIYTTVIDSRAVTIRLTRLEKGSTEKSVDVLVNNRPINAKETTIATASSQSNPNSIPLGGKNQVLVSKISGDSVSFTASCPDNANNQNSQSFVSGGFTLAEGGSANPCGVLFVLKNINAEKLAIVRILPNVHNTETETNLSVTIGIEKRVIQLSPEKTKEMISNINDTIKKFQSISKTLGNVVTGLKTACFATATALTIKNFVSGLDGTSMARKDVMDGAGKWTERCQTAFKTQKDPITGETKKYASVSDCINQNADTINKMVKAEADAINSINDGISARDKQNNLVKSSLFFGDIVDTDKSAEQTLQHVQSALGSSQLQITVPKLDGSAGTETINLGTFVNSLTQTSNVNGQSVDAWGKHAISYQDLKDLELYSQLSQADIGTIGQADAKTKLADIVTRVEANLRSFDSVQKADTSITGQIGVRTQLQSFNTNSKAQQMYYYGNSYTIADNIKGIEIPAGATSVPIEYLNINNQPYAITLHQSSTGSEIYGVTGVYSINLATKAATKLDTTSDIYKALTAGVSGFKKTDVTSCSNQYLSPEVSYFETEPYKGMPHIVPVDTANGWYAATEQVIGALGQQTAYESNARVSSFWLCNVGKDKRVNFDSMGRGDDICQQFNLNTGQSQNKFSCMSDSQTQIYVNRAISRLNQAAQQHTDGLRRVSLDGESIPVGTPGSNIPSAQCESFMSPKECQLLFNVCDPVICPSSRCNLGGLYSVPDVIQTGVIGSTLLCLPNAKEGIYIPVCLTGIQAGLDGYISLLQNHRDCLQENLDTGQTVGICDQIYSVYACEFFWNQVAPVAKAILPKLVEKAYGNGQGGRGGGEYLTIMNAWKNTQDSINYFTQTYAVNSIKAFQARSVEEFGDLYCKAFVSLKGPTALKTLVEPDSPPQFNAWFSATKFTDATIPATSQYKVFYHIFAGKDSGVYYSVYLKNPPQTAYYATAQQIYLASGFINKGEYASETKDFTAPEGYKTLCVRINADEECGFGMVSTSFAVNYVSDMIAKDTLTQTGITSSSSCVSGDPSIGTVLGGALTGNLESAAAGLSPQIYNKGIVRICATDNPGKSTDPSRFVDVGYCDDSRTRCWLDMNSVNNSISAYDLGMKNATVSELQSVATATLSSQQGLITDTNTAKRILDTIDTNIQAIDIKDITNAQLSADSNISLIDSLLSPTSSLQLYYNPDRARALFLRGFAGEQAARADLINKQSSQPSSAGSTTSTPTKTVVTAAEAKQKIAEIAAATPSVKPSDNPELAKAIKDAHDTGLITDAEYNDYMGVGLFDLQENAQTISQAVNKPAAYIDTFGDEVSKAICFVSDDLTSSTEIVGETVIATSTASGLEEAGSILKEVAETAKNAPKGQLIVKGGRTFVSLGDGGVSYGGKLLTGRVLSSFASGLVFYQLYCSTYEMQYTIRQAYEASVEAQDSANKADIQYWNLVIAAAKQAKIVEAEFSVISDNLDLAKNPSNYGSANTAVISCLNGIDISKTQQEVARLSTWSKTLLDGYNKYYNNADTDTSGILFWRVESKITIAEGQSLSTAVTNFGGALKQTKASIEGLTNQIQNCKAQVLS